MAAVFPTRPGAMSAPAARPNTRAAARLPARLPTQSPARPPKAPPPRKARSAAECEQLEQLPNIGPSIAADLRLLGLRHPAELARQDALELYHRLCAATGKRQDPCVLDTFMSATDFMRGAAPRPWWEYTAQRKALYGAV